MDERDVDANQRDGGFTLVELLIVIVILGILSAVVVIAIGGITDRGQDSACESDERALRTAAEAHFAEAGTYATNEAALVAADFLSEESTLHNYTSADGESFVIEPVAGGDCATPTT